MRTRMVCYEVEHSADADASIRALVTAGATNVVVLGADEEEGWMAVEVTLPADTDYMAFRRAYESAGGC